jgi:catechol 2,3-dioxygenase-like lactoylglutathione lyase family enzyme
MAPPSIAGRLRYAAVPRRLQHCGLIVADLDRSRAFYGGALGLAEVSRPHNFTFEGAWFQVGDDQLHLLVEAETTGRARGPDPGRSASVGLATHIALEVDDLDVALARLDEHGVPLIGGPMPRGDGYVQVFMRDPDGYVVELFEYTGEDQSDAPLRAPIRD